MSETKEGPKRNDGSYALDMENKKISITTSTGQHSVLFEDIASTSFNSESEDMPAAHTPETKKAMLTGVALIVIGFILGSIGAEDFSGFIVLAGIIYWIWKGRPKASKDTWDKVTIETRGGKQVPYCVDLGQGKIDMDVIEEARKK
jgi:hypothetical protein|tara:strand:+ start:422 stop:859 length:438 start_codon:yes stop_codon:yes gene_type:complete